MKKVLFLPLLQMPSGHHQVADSLIRAIEGRVTGVCCKKLDFLSDMNELFEKLVTGAYLKWIHYLPKTYHLAYRLCAGPDTDSLQLHQYLYRALFIRKMEDMLEREQPDLVVCTHGFPSFLISRLKEKGRVKIPVVNVYTDFFINSVWGTNAIDYHCVADEELKKKLIEEQAIPPERVFVTGIPIDEVFTATGRNTPSSPYHVLISGGSNGLGSILDFLQYVSKGSSVRYSVLCGSNTKLYEEINSWGVDQIRPLPYIHSREQMNRLYASVDAIVTKPGGVTVSEALANRLPIFINSALPGQEEINRAHLVSQGLVYELNTNQPYEEQLLRVLNNRWELGLWQKRVEEYHQKKDISAREIIVGVLTGLRSAIC